jgi:hypothetical protein
MLNPIFPTAHHPNDKWLAAVPNIPDLSQGHVSKVKTEVAVLQRMKRAQDRPEKRS